MSDPTTAGSRESARLVLTTAPDQACAERIANALVEQGLAACVNLVPGILSIYRWKGQVERAGEVLLIAKTSARRLHEFEAVLARVHPYEVPECIAVEPARVEEKYLAWLLQECGSSPRP